MGYKKGYRLHDGPEWTVLDDSPMAGDDPWKTVGHVAFTHWDRWMLRLALDEPTGLSAIAQAFEKQIVLSRVGPADEMRAYVDDLRARVATAGQQVATMLEPHEAASLWLQKRARDRVWSGTSRTPAGSHRLVARRVWQAPWTRPDWSPFAISPAPSAAFLGRHFAHGEYYDWRGVGLVTEVLDRDIVDLLGAAKNEAERLAALRATLGVLVQAFEQVDDSGAHVATLFAECSAAYFVCLRPQLARPGLLADLLELMVWEDHGLFGDVDPFLRSLPAEAKAVGRAALEKMADELAKSGLSQQRTALGMREVLVG